MLNRRVFIAGGLSSANILGASAADYALPDKAGISSGFQDTTGRVVVQRPSGRVGVFLATGQSLAGAHVQGLYQPRHRGRILNLNLYDGRLFDYVDPPLGPTFTINGYQNWTEGYGAIWGEVGDILVDRGALDYVVWAVPAIGGTTVQDWTDGVYADRNQVAVRRLTAAGLKLTAGISLLGESDGIAKTDPGTFTRSYRQMIDAVRTEAGFRLPWIVTQDTWAYGLTSEPIRTAQVALADRGDLIIQGPDLDQFTDGYRYAEIAGPSTDHRVHPNAAGRHAMATAIAAAIMRLSL